MNALADELRARADRLAHLAKTIRVKESRPGKAFFSAEGVSGREVSLSEVNLVRVFVHFEEELRRQSFVRSGSSKQKIVTKERARTVGVYARSGLWVALENLAAERGQKPSVIYRNLLRSGVHDLNKRLDKESSARVFGELTALLEGFDGAEKVQKMVRIDKDFYDQAIFIAKEFRKSMSEITSMCMAYGLSKVVTQQPVAES
ncbi:hypothetical protein [Pseudoxanthomonas putridarboris]|uniref:hypothetical protein n=1 Tax=Pseudoxanthomonas putridarboris TaxID=752605 RepID=UPI00311E8A48